MIGRTVLVAAMLFALAGSAPSAAMDKQAARTKVDELLSASAATGLCHEFRVSAGRQLAMLGAAGEDLDGDLDALKALVDASRERVVEAVSMAYVKLGHERGCEALWSEFGEAGSLAPGLLTRAW